MDMVKTYRRDFQGEADQEAMLELACQYPENCLHVVDLPYRLSSWALEDAGNGSLWYDEQGKLFAWAAMNSPFWTIDYVLHPGTEERLLPEVLDWAIMRVKELAGTLYERPSWYAMVFADQNVRICHLENAGFASQANVGEDSWSKVLMERPGELPVANYRLPEGFQIRPLAGESEVEDYVALHRAAFDSKSMTAGWRKRTLLHRVYLPDLDLVVEAPDGRLAAFCIGWFCDNVGGKPAGRIEPLGVHKDFRTPGYLGRAVLGEVLRRLQAHGAASIFVETDNYRNTALALYENVGFKVIKDVLVYRRDSV